LPNAKRIAKGSTSTFRDQNVERNDEEPFFRIAIRARSSETVVRFRSMPFFTVDVKTAPPTSGAGPLKPNCRSLRASGDQGRDEVGDGPVVPDSVRWVAAATCPQPVTLVPPARCRPAALPQAEFRTPSRPRTPAASGGTGATTEEFDLGRASANAAGRGKKRRRNLCAGVSSVRPCQPHDDELDRAGGLGSWRQRRGGSRTF